MKFSAERGTPRSLLALRDKAILTCATRCTGDCGEPCGGDVGPCGEGFCGPAGRPGHCIRDDKAATEDGAVPKGEAWTLGVNGAEEGRDGGLFASILVEVRLASRSNIAVGRHPPAQNLLCGGGQAGCPTRLDRRGRPDGGEARLRNKVGNPLKCRDGPSVEVAYRMRPRSPGRPHMKPMCALPLARSTWVNINLTTRRLTKLPEDVKVQK